MRCRKVRSCLSAFCSDELKGRKRLAVREHLATCSGCRREASLYQSMLEAGRELAGPKVSDDFNARLLNRVAQERFAETRTKAYLPKPAPVIAWGRLAPVMSAVAVMALVVGWFAMSGPNNGITTASNDGSEAAPHMTAQPVDNPNVTGALGKNWSLHQHIQRNDRMARLSKSIMRNVGFNETPMAGLTFRVTRQPGRVPYVTTYFRIQPIIRVYQSSNRMVAQEDDLVY